MRKFSLFLLAISVAACVQSGTGDPEADGGELSPDAMSEDASPPDAPPPDAPPGPPTLAVTATPMTINLGQSTNINWLSANTANCKSRGEDQPLNGTYTVSPTENTVYTVVCTGLNGVGIQGHVNVTVTQPPTPPPPTVDVQATLTTINLGQNTTVTWTSANATSCTNSQTSSQLSADTFTVYPTVTTTYAVVCSGPGGQGQDSVTVTVVQPPPPPAPTLTVTANPTTINVGGTTTVNWDSTNATYCKSWHNGNWVDQPIDGSWPGLTPTTTTVYSLVCYSASGAQVSGSVTVTVNAAPPPTQPTMSMSASPTAIVAGGSSTITWASMYTTGCNSNQGPQAVSGTWTVSPTTTTTYSITCTGPGGNVTRTALVTVYPLPMLSFTANPTTINVGGSSCLSWSSANTTSCTVNSASKPTSGSLTVSPTSTTTYTATCTGPGGQITKTVTVTVNVPPPPPVPTLSFSATPATITVGQSSTLSWSTANATSCTATGSWSGSKPVNGTLVVSPTSNAKYQLSCTGPGGTVNGTADVWVNALPNLPPTVSITSPVNNATFVAPASFTVMASASDPDAGDTVVVQLYKGGAPFGSGANGQLSNLVVGTYVLTAKATDNHGAETVSSPVTITVTQPQTPNQPPSVSLASNNSIFFVAPATVELRASVSDSDGTVVRVEFKNGNALIFNDTSAPFEYNWANVPVGVYNTTAVAFDDDGASATSNQLTITVSASSGDVPCHGLGIYFSNTKLNTITSCSKWDKLGAGSAIMKNNFIDGGIGACGITCSNSSGVTVLPDAVTGVWLQNGTSDVSRWYTTGCANLPPHPPEAPQAGGAWDKRCQVSTNPLGGPPDTNN